MSKEGKILIVDDDDDILTAGKILLKREFETIATANKPDLIPRLMQDHKFDVILLDMNFGSGETSGRQGLQWLARILDADPDASVILITAHSAVDVAVEAMKIGAADFVEKPWQNERLITTIKNTIRLRQSVQEAQSLRQTKDVLIKETLDTHQQILGNSPGIRKVLDMVNRAGPTDANVLILGENGTGKELIAREIHYRSNRASEIFLSVDLGAVAETLFESELFGHKKGAFTDAKSDRIGRFEAANGGTLFLDEIGNIPLHLQPKLLTALEQRVVTPVGATKPVAFDVRVICATNMPQAQLQDEACFRPDLLYRLNTVEIHLPPLRERREDIPLLADDFLGTYARKYNRAIEGINPDAMARLQAYDWPGNIRALRHAIERAVILSDGKQLEVDDFSLQPTPSAGDKPTIREDVTLEDMERQAIEQALKSNEGNISKAAKALGLTRTSLYRRMEKYGL